MRYLALLFILFQCACGTCDWKKDIRTGARLTFETVKTSEGIAVQLQQAKCMTIAKKCGAETPGNCPALQPCKDVRHKIEDSAIGVYRAIVAVLLGLEYTEEKDAVAKLDKVKLAAKNMYELLLTVGVLK